MVKVSIFALSSVVISFLIIGHTAWGAPTDSSESDAKAIVTESLSPPSVPQSSPAGSSRLLVLVSSLTVFVLAVIVGFEIIAKVPPTLHTPLMSGSNAISGITVVGAIISAGNHNIGFASLLGLFALILANINVVGGFWVTHRMLLMFKKK